MLTSFFTKVISVFMSFFLSIGAFFGIVEAPERVEDQNKIKNVIYLIGDGMGFNHLEKTKNERGVSLTMDSFEFQAEQLLQQVSEQATV